MVKAAFYTFGCKLNQHEAMAMEESLRRERYDIVAFDQKADVFIVNSCTVTGKSDHHCRQLIRRCARENPKSAIVVTGCYAQRVPHELARLPGVRLVLGNRDKFDLAGKLAGMNGKGISISTSSLASGKAACFPGVCSFGSYTRAFVKIQDGCNNQCAYCIVWKVRGKNASDNEENVLRQISHLARSGYREVVLTGIHMGTWGVDLTPRRSLADLLERVVALEEVPKIRLSSIEPNEITDRLIEIISRNSSICRHFHIPLQSGSDRILSRMNRNYTKDEYEKLIDRISAAIPGVAIGADVMVGFPGETEADFKETCELVERLPLTYLHVFNYSRRPGTSAADMLEQVPPDIRGKRSRRMRSLGARKAFSYRQGLVGQGLPCLVESRRDRETGLLKALSDNYLKILFQGPDSLYNSYINLSIEKVERGRIYGHIKD